MRHAWLVIVTILAVSLILLVGECAKHQNEFPDYQPYTKRFEQINEATK